MAKFNPNSTEYHVATENVLINYEFVRDYCGTMRGWISEFSKEELEDMSEYIPGLGFTEDPCYINIGNHMITETSAQLKLHWLPVAVVDLPKYLHFGWGSGMHVNEVSKLLQDYVVFCFREAAKELLANEFSHRYDIRSYKCWRNPDVVKVIAKHVFGMHYKSVGDKLYNAIECIMKSDRYLAMGHVRSLMKSEDDYNYKVGDILLHALNHASKDYISNFKVENQEFYCSSESAGADFDNFVNWCSEYLTNLYRSNPEKEHKTLFTLTPEALEYINKAPVFSMDEFERMCEPNTDFKEESEI